MLLQARDVDVPASRLPAVTAGATRRSAMRCDCWRLPGNRCGGLSGRGLPAGQLPRAHQTAGNSSPVSCSTRAPGPKPGLPRAPRDAPLITPIPFWCRTPRAGEPKIKAANESAANFLGAQVHEFPGQITIIAAGPLNQHRPGITPGSAVQLPRQRIGLHGRQLQSHGRRQ